MLGLPLTFAAPVVLWTLVALPAIWLLLRITPPQPRRIAFPPLRIFADLVPRRETPARTPWWLLALRLLLAAALIGAAAGPIWNPAPSTGGSGPLLLVLDNGFPAAHDWRERARLAIEQAEAASRDGRPLAVLATADAPAEIVPAAASAGLERLRAVRPQPHLVDRSRHLETIGRFLGAWPAADVAWLSDGTVGAEPATFAAELAALVPNAARLTVYKPERATALALTGPENGAAGLKVRVLRPEPNGRDSGRLRALDLKSLPLGEASFAFAPGATETEAGFELPVEIRNAIARVEIAGEASAGAVALLDEHGKRRRVGIVSGATADQAQPLLAPSYYLVRALAPHAEIREGRGGIADAVSHLLDEQVTVLILADVGALDPGTLKKVTAFVEGGGVLVRFAGSRLAAGNDDLVPVRLRRGGRNLGGTLSWDAPRTLAPFARESPFHDLVVPREIGVRRQILAEPDGELAQKTWASLEDGTPIVTGAKRGEGLTVLVHVTADTTWSNLPLSGLFVDMMRRLVALAGSPDASGAGNARSAQAEAVAPRLVLDGFGSFVPPPPTAKAVPRASKARAVPDHPPGFYGPVESSFAVNALAPEDRLAPLDVAGLKARVAPLTAARTLDLRAALFTLALLLLAADTLASLWLGGQLGALLGRLRPARAGVAALVMAAAFAWAGAPHAALAQGGPSQRLEGGAEAALVTRLAYVVTGDAAVDATSRAGLQGLTEVLANGTALEPGEPVAIDPARDELAFYALLYWPIVASRPQPSEAAIRRVDAFMKNGGTVIFDTRDALNARPGAQTPEAQRLQRMLAILDVPELEPVPRDHVLTKAFYLVDSFPGRYATGQTWVEVLPPVAEGERRPARAGDGVSPLIITSNDLAAAWAIDRRGDPLHPLNETMPRQREFAFRGGVNIVMYTLTGNYKADQVHVPALLERLGQ